MSSGSSAPVYAVIINYNGWRNTVECLESVYRSDYPALRVSVLDNASTDDSLRHLRDWIGRHLSHLPEAARPRLVPMGANLGFAGANNVALRELLMRETNAYAWLLNNDTTVAPDALRLMVETAERDRGIGAVGATLLQYHDPGRLETAGGGTVAEWHGMVATIAAGAARGGRPADARMDFVAGTCVLVPRHVVERVGLMDERYFLYGEDIDWGLRIREAGYRLAYCAAAEVWHKGGGSTQHGSALHDYHCVKSSLLLVHKRRPALLPLALAYSVGRCVLPKLARGELRRIGAVLRGYRDFARQVARGATEV